MTPEEIVDEFIRRVVAMDLDSACELVAEDVIYDNVPMTPVEGPAGIRAVLGPMVEGLDSAEFVIHRQVAAGNLVMNERTDRFVVGDKSLDLPVAGVFEIVDGKIALWRDFFDMQTLNDGLTNLMGA